MTSKNLFILEKALRALADEISEFWENSAELSDDEFEDQCDELKRRVEDL